MAIPLPDLPYGFNALEPLVSTLTLKTHYSRHHRGYVDNLNALVAGSELGGKPLEEIVRRSARRSAVDPKMTAVFNNAAQAWNHTFYWRSLTPRGGKRRRARWGGASTLISGVTQGSLTPSRPRQPSTSAVAGHGW